MPVQTALLRVTNGQAESQILNLHWTQYPSQILNKPEYTHSAKLNLPKSERKYEVIKKLTPTLVDRDPVEDLLFNHPDPYGIGTPDDKEVDEPQAVRKTGLRFEIEDPIDLSDVNLVARYDGNLKEQELTQVKKKAAKES
ncbi:hypothetical protein C8J56DRAFT_888685 [Mycena floridula]|nr:hypothetical protein C8J56DRAFT_888685 [Mycena floridula]